MRTLGSGSTSSLIHPRSLDRFIEVVRNSNRLENCTSGDGREAEFSFYTATTLFWAVFDEPG